MTAPGVSVVVCCHNGAARLGPTLAHLAAQRVPAGVAAEVVVVDNASADGTADAARRLWPAAAPLPLRVVAEPTPGLSHARRRGLAAARFAFVSFVDDDNWVCPDWVAVVHEVLAAHPAVGACGGPTAAAFDAPPPPWFGAYQGYFAVGEQHARAGDVTDRPNALWGAGLSVRKAAWDGLLAGGFRFALSDRTGAGLTSGGDHELCLALALAGWRLWYDPRLRLEHQMPAGRLTWAYLRRLLRGAGWGTAWLDPYHEALGRRPPGRPGWDAVRVAFLLARNPLRLLASVARAGEGRPEVAVHELLVGRLAALVRGRRGIGRLRAELRRARWAARGRAVG